MCAAIQMTLWIESRGVVARGEEGEEGDDGREHPRAWE